MQKTKSVFPERTFSFFSFVSANISVAAVQNGAPFCKTEKSPLFNRIVCLLSQEKKHLVCFFLQVFIATNSKDKDDKVKVTSCS